MAMPRPFAANRLHGRSWCLCCRRLFSLLLLSFRLLCVLRGVWLMLRWWDFGGCRRYGRLESHDVSLQFFPVFFGAVVRIGCPCARGRLAVRRGLSGPWCVAFRRRFLLWFSFAMLASLALVWAGAWRGGGGRCRYRRGGGPGGSYPCRFFWGSVQRKGFGEVGVIFRRRRGRWGPPGMFRRGARLFYPRGVGVPFPARRWGPWVVRRVPAGVALRRRSAGLVWA